MLYFLYWLIVANTVGFMLMVIDKSRAERQMWRISEQTLVLWSMAGGSFGTAAAQHILRHKTRKQPIAGTLRSMPVLHVILGAAWGIGLFDLLYAAWLAQA